MRRLKPGDEHPGPMVLRVEGVGVVIELSDLGRHREHRAAVQPSLRRRGVEKIDVSGFWAVVNVDCLGRFVPRAPQVLADGDEQRVDPALVGRPDGPLHVGRPSRGFGNGKISGLGILSGLTEYRTDDVPRTGVELIHAHAFRASDDAVIHDVRVLADLPVQR